MNGAAIIDHMIKLKRIYDEPETSDGFRILVDRLWPRGVTKERARLDLWLKDIAPSNELRKWFGHDPKRWAAFQKKYKTELLRNKKAIAELKQIAKKEGIVTLLYAAKDNDHNEAIVIKEAI